MKDPAKCAQWGLFILRLVVGFIFVFHGFQKFALWGNAGASMAPSMLLLMQFTSVVEFVAGLALMAGMWTRLAAAALAIIMIGSIYFLQFVMNVGFSTSTGAGWEYNLTLLAALVCLKFGGPGVFACKGCCGKEKSGEQEKSA
ncbi:MAG: DoxX family protein [Patescibacteria group bacterium]